MQPLFSIIVPTRNRSQQLAKTLLPLTRQTNSDFELVVSDNSDPSEFEKNQKIVEIVSNTFPVRLIRPKSTLNMTNHWNFALDAAKGKYVGVVTDRMTLHPTTLEKSYKFLDTGTKCVSYSHTTLRKTGSSLSLTEDIEPEVKSELVRSKAVIMDFANATPTGACPRLLNSFVAKTVLEKMRQEVGTTVSGICPDYSFLFGYLARYESYVHIRNPLLIDHSPEVSNGMAATRNKPNKASGDFEKLVKEEQTESMNLRLMPSDHFFFLNLISAEYEFASRLEHYESFPSFDHEKMYRACLKQAAKYLSNNEISKSSISALEEYRKRQKISRSIRYNPLYMKFRMLRNSYKQWKMNKALTDKAVSENERSVSELIEEGQKLADFLEG
ncbi:MAG: glycosyltransferase family 2 protein [Rhizobiaceae bacterium]|nr:glycosyltransferase family 2 protein [Rhizobiaceae bacterium]